MWTATRIDSPAAAGATVAVDLTSVACTAARACVVVGGYADSAFVQWGLIAELAGGAWTVTTAPVLPDNALGRGPLKSLTCPAAGECAALGADFVPHSETPLAYVQSGGAWTVSAVPLPADAIASRQQAILQSLSCPAPGSCVAVGQYDSSTVSRTNDPTMEPTRGLIATLAGGAWSTASGAVVPGASVLRSVDCWAPGSCAAVGIQQFPRTPSLQATEGLVETLAGGVWTYGNAPAQAGLVPKRGMRGRGRIHDLQRPARTVRGLAQLNACVAPGGYRASANVGSAAIWLHAWVALLEVPSSQCSVSDGLAYQPAGWST